MKGSKSFKFRWTFLAWSAMLVVVCATTETEEAEWKGGESSWTQETSKQETSNWEEARDLAAWTSGSCAEIADCGNCTQFYTCHWCAFDQECHARGSIHGCSWGATCDPKPPKENTTCASHTTCSECALSSHLCHWCEHDNACHAVGSPYGCSTGVDCYSNDRCRRTEPETFRRWVVLEIPPFAVGVLLSVAFFLVACLTACRKMVSYIQGNSLSAGGSGLPPSVLAEPLGDADVDMDADTSSPNAQAEEEEAPTEAVVTSESTLGEATATPEGVADEESPHEEPNQSQSLGPTELDADPILDANDADLGLETPLLPRPTSSSSVSPHRKALYRICSCFHYGALALVLVLLILALVFYPKMPVYDVCSDAVAWGHIIAKLATLKLDASFEILVSVSNPNHVTVALDNCTGSFSFQGEPVGTYEIPAESVDAMAVTDLMLIARVTPNKHQAYAMAQEYYHGNLLLVADFNATLRAPALFDISVDIHLQDINVYANEMGPRDLCHCPSWDDSKNHTLSKFVSLLEGADPNDFFELQ